MLHKTILVTGANGEIGHGLISHFAEQSDIRVVALDVAPLAEDLARRCFRTITGDILDGALLARLVATHDFHAIYHLAAVLSTKAERQPVLGHRVNVDGTVNLLEMANEQARAQGRTITFLFPSSIAVYGLPDLSTKLDVGKIKESEWCRPRTVYGVTKLYIEELGRYYAKYYRQLDAQETRGRVDFRSIRFPGLISANTLPSGGTSDYASEMVHAAALGTPYACFVREDTRIPFMTMPDAIEALLRLEAASSEGFSRLVYNVGSFSISAAELLAMLRGAFANAKVTFAPDLRRQAIVDSWPADVDDTAARAEWGWRPRFDTVQAFDEYLFPAIAKRYGA